MSNIDPSDMSDDELEAAFRAARAEQDAANSVPDVETPDTDETDPNDVTTDEDVVTTEEDNSDDPSAASTETDEDDDPEAEPDGDPVTEPDTEVAGKTADKKTKEKSVEQPATPEPNRFKANGKEFEITDEEMKQMFPKVFGQAADYTKKMQQIKPWRKTIDALEQAKLKHEDINLMIDVFKGDKNAIAEVLKRTGVDAIDINQEEASYKGNDYGRDETTLDLSDVLESISGDSKYAITHNILSKEWDDASFAELSADPEKVRLLHIDVMSGVYEKLLPDMQLAKVVDRGRKSDLEYYMEAASKFVAKNEAAQLRERQLALNVREQELAEQNRIAKVQSDAHKRTADKAASERRKAAATTGRSVGKPGAKDYLKDIDEDFDEWYKKLEDR